MDFNEALKDGCYSLDLKGSTKQAIIEEMVDLLIEGGKIAAGDRDVVLAAVMEREEKMSTGVQHGVAVPHGKTEIVGDLVTAVALKKEGIDFASLDGEPSRIFVMTISSPLRSGPHLQYLGEISKLLNVASVRENILKVESREELIDLLTGSAPENRESVK